MKILILGGTGEARELAGRLVALGHEVTTSFAGRTREPRLPDGGVRVGKFGGVLGLAGYLQAAGIDRLIDVTHPYAEAISMNAVAAAKQTGIPLVRVARPAWAEPPGANWRHVPDLGAAADALPSGAKALISTGHEGLELFLARDDCRLVIRLIERPGRVMPDHAQLILQRPPYTLEAERTLFRQEAFTHLVTKNSGGDATAAKLVAARESGVVVIMIERPVYGPGVEVGSVEEAVRMVTGT